VNRVTDGLFPPGSTFKTVTLSGGIDSGEESLSTPYTGKAATGPYSINGYTLSNATSNLPPGATSATLLQAFTWSDNIVYAQVGLKLGWSGLLHYASGFLIGHQIPFPIPVTPSQVLAPGEPKTPFTLATSSFGQGQDLVTPLQMMLVAGAIANNGKIALPVLIKAIKTPSGITAYTEPSQTVSTAISPQTANTVKHAMEQVVYGYYGSGFEAAIPGVTVAGKTGTAQTGNNNALDTWFISFAPVDHPTVAVAVVVQAPAYCPVGNSFTTVCEGAYVAAPIARQIMATAIQDHE
jgi:peptidoglycan glycosyltransferase